MQKINVHNQRAILLSISPQVLPAATDSPSAAALPSPHASSEDSCDNLSSSFLGSDGNFFALEFLLSHIPPEQMHCSPVESEYSAVRDSLGNPSH